MKVLWSEVDKAYEESNDVYPNDVVTESGLRDCLKKFSDKIDTLINRVNEPEPVEEPREIDPDFGHYAEK